MISFCKVSFEVAPSCFPVKILTQKFACVIFYSTSLRFTEHGLTERCTTYAVLDGVLFKLSNVIIF